MVHHYFALSHSMCCIHMLSLHSLHCYAFIPFKHIFCFTVAWILVVACGDFHCVVCYCLVTSKDKGNACMRVAFGVKRLLCFVYDVAVESLAPFLGA